MANKYLALKGEKFDISKVTVVGSPTITSDGVASGLSNNDYIVPTSLTLEQLKGKSWSYSFKCTIPDTSASSKYIISFANNLFPSLVGGIKFEGYGIYLGGKYGTTEDSTNELWKMIGTYSRPADVGKEVLITVSFNIETGEYNAKAILDNKELNMTPYIPPTANKELYYINTNSSSKAFRVLVGNDKFYLKSIKITINNQLVYSPTKPVRLLERRKEGFDLSKFTVVGTPTITEDGVASGLDNNNYLDLGITKLNATKEITVTIHGIHGETQTTAGVLFRLRGGTNEVVFYRNKFSKMSGEIGERTDSTTNWTYLPDSRVTANNTPYSIKYTLDLPNNICSYDYYENNVFVGNYSKKITSINLADVDWKSLTITQIGRGYSAVLGSIDLPSFSITADGKEVFTGAKEQFYMLRNLVSNRMDYTPLAWIGNESNCRMFIPLVTAAADIVEIEYEAQFTRLDAQQAEIKNGFPYFFVGCVANGVWYAGCTNYGNTTVQADKNWHKFKLVSYGNDNGFWLDGERIYQGGVTTAVFLPEGFSLWIGHGGSRTVYNRKKYVKVRVNGQLVYNLIPVLDKNSIPCMYDLVSKSYFRNEGTGQFTYSLGG